jgi:hypothetical protein
MAFFIDAVMPSLIENVWSWTGRKILKHWLIHMDDMRPHNSGCAQRWIQASRAEPLPHPAHSPDLALSDFVLFGSINGKLSDYNCKSRTDLLNAITEIFTGVDQEVLLSVFESWVNRHKWVIKHEGSTGLTKEKTRDTSSRLAEKPGARTDRPAYIFSSDSGKVQFTSARGILTRSNPIFDLLDFHFSFFLAALSDIPHFER